LPRESHLDLFRSVTSTYGRQDGLVARRAIWRCQRT